MPQIGHKPLQVRPMPRRRKRVAGWIDARGTARCSDCGRFVRAGTRAWMHDAGIACPGLRCGVRRHIIAQN